MYDIPKNQGFCPHCKKERTSGAPCQRSVKYDPISPWSFISKTFTCDFCHNAIPGHIWTTNKDKWKSVISEWESTYKFKKDLLTIAVETKDATRFHKLIEVCDDELRKPCSDVDHPRFFHIKSLAYIGLKDKRQAYETVLKGIKYDSSKDHPKLYINLISLSLDLGKFEFAKTEIQRISKIIHFSDQYFLKKKILKAFQKGNLSKKEISDILMNLNILCAVCGAEREYIPRYPISICKSCRSRITDGLGRKVNFSNSNDPKNMFGGGKVIGQYTEAESSYRSTDCWIDEFKCTARVARFGGVVIEVDFKYPSYITKNALCILNKGKEIEKQSLLSFVAQYHRMVLKSDKPVSAIIKILNLKSSYYVYKLQSQIREKSFNHLMAVFNLKSPGSN